MTSRFSGRLVRRIGMTALAVGLAVIGMAAAQDLRATSKDGVPTPEQYVATAGGDSRILTPREFVLDGHRPQCGQRPTVIDNKLDDYGAAYPGFIIMNPKYLAKVSTPVKLWIYAHECGHQFRGPDEQTADCFAVQRGRRYGWLTAEGLEEVCTFIAPAKGDAMHFSGSYRCDYMRKCYADPGIR